MVRLTESPNMTIAVYHALCNSTVKKWKFFLFFVLLLSILKVLYNRVVLISLDFRCSLTCRLNQLWKHSIFSNKRLL